MTDTREQWRTLEREWWSWHDRSGEFLTIKDAKVFLAERGYRIVKTRTVRSIIGELTQIEGEL